MGVAAAGWACAAPAPRAQTRGQPALARHGIQETEGGRRNKDFGRLETRAGRAARGVGCSGRTRAAWVDRISAGARAGGPGAPGQTP